MDHESGMPDMSSGCLTLPPSTIIQLEREKNQLEHQVSELVRNAESKRAEIAALRMEINQIKESSEQEVSPRSYNQRLEALEAENESLKERLLSAATIPGAVALSDSEKEMLLRRSASNSAISLDSASRFGPGPMANTSGSSSLPPLGATGGGDQWEKSSTSSISEVACLQDRIMQMEESHYCTNEELQATLQELVDLQNQVTGLQVDGERWTEEKAVLLESLCSQTQKLDEAQAEIIQLKCLLFQQEPLEEKEKHFICLLQTSHEDQSKLLVKQEQLQHALDSCRREIEDYQHDVQDLTEKVSILQNTLESTLNQRSEWEHRATLWKEQLNEKELEITQLKAQLEQLQNKAAKGKEGDDGGEGGKEKGGEAQQLDELREQMALRVAREEKLREQLAAAQVEYKDLEEKSLSQRRVLELRVSQMELESDRLQRERDVFESQVHKNADEIRELRGVISGLQNSLSETLQQLRSSEKELEGLRFLRNSEKEEWSRFQADLLTSVRVANDFKTEAILQTERLHEELRLLREKVATLQEENQRLRRDSASNTFSKWSSGNNNVRALIESIENCNKHAKAQTSSSQSSPAHTPTSPPIDQVDGGGGGQGQGRRVASTSAPSPSSSAPNTPINHHLHRHRLPSTTALNNGSAKSVMEASSSRLFGNGDAVNGGGSVGGSVGGGSPARATPPARLSILQNKENRRTSYGEGVLEKKDPLAALVKGGGSKRNALLKWCQNKTIAYKGIDITNFSSSWNDGLAFCALLHSYLPEKIPYNELLEARDKRRNFTVAFRAAESVGIPCTLNISDLIAQERPDWQAIMGYVTQIYKHFEAS